MSKLSRMGITLSIFVLIGVIAWRELTPVRESPSTVSLGAIPLDDETLIFASISGLAPKYIDRGPEKGMGWAEVQTQEVRKGLIQDGFKVTQEWMTPARIAHEMRSHHPICTFPVEWNHPAQLFAKKQDRLYSIALTLAEQETRTILVNKKDTSRFSKHLDPKGDLNLESLFKDPTLKTVLIRDKDYGFITQRLTEVNEAGEQVVRDEFKTHVSLLVVKDNRQLIEMLHAERFDYSFSELDQKELSDSRLDARQFGQIPYDTIKVRDSRDPNLVQVSIACSVHPLTLKALPFINRWISMYRGIHWEVQKRSYRSLMEGKEVSERSRYGMVMAFKGVFDAGVLDHWFSLQARHFPGLTAFPPEASDERITTSSQIRSAPTLRWIQVEEEPGEVTFFNETSTGLREEFNSNLSPYPPQLLNFQVSRLVAYLSPSQRRILNDSMPFLERKSYPSIDQIPDVKSPPQNLRKLTVFAFGLKPKDFAALKPWLQSSFLEDLSFYGGSGPVIEELVASLPKSIRRLNLTASSLTLTSFPEAVRGLPLSALHLNDAELSEAQLKRVLENLPESIEELSLGFHRRAWTATTAQAFGKKKFPRLRTLDLENSFIFDAAFQWMIKGIPTTLEELNLAYNTLTHKTLRPLLDQKLPRLRSLDLSGNFPLGRYSTRNPLVLSRALRTFAAQDCSLTPDNLSDLILPEGLTNLNLSNNVLKDEGFAMILPKLGKSLDRLRLSNTRLSRRSMEALAGSGIVQVEDLHLGTNLLSDADIEELSHSKIQIGRLFLPGNRISTRGAKLIAEKWMSSLQALSLAGNPISNSGIAELANQWSSKLLELDLGGVLSLDVEKLGAMLPSKLALLDLSQNQLLNSEVEMLSKHLPKTLETLILSGAIVDRRGGASLASHMPPFIHQLALDKVPLGGDGVVTIFESVPAGLRKMVVGPVKLTPRQTQRIAETLPRGLISIRWIQTRFAPDADVVIHSLPGSLRECFFISTPVILSQVGMKDLSLPSNLRDFSLEGAARDLATIEALVKVLPASLEEFLSYGTAALVPSVLEELSKRNSSNQRAVSFGTHRSSAKSVGLFLKKGGGPRILGLFGLAWENPRDFEQIDSSDLKNVRAAFFSNFALPSSTLLALVKHLPEEMFILSLNSAGITFSTVKPLIQILPRGLRVLNISGNDVGEKGLELFRSYKAKKEKEEGVPFSLIE